MILINAGDGSFAPRTGAVAALLAVCILAWGALHAKQPVKDIPFDVCVLLGDYNPSSAAYVFAARDNLFNAEDPGFRSIVEVESLEDAQDCDLVIGLSQPGFWSVLAEIISVETEEVLTSVKGSGPRAGKKIIDLEVAHELTGQER